MTTEIDMRYINTTVYFRLFPIGKPFFFHLDSIHNRKAIDSQLK